MIITDTIGKAINWFKDKGKQTSMFFFPKAEYLWTEKTEEGLKKLGQGYKITNLQNDIKAHNEGLFDTLYVEPLKKTGRDIIEPIQDFGPIILILAVVAFIILVK